MSALTRAARIAGTAVRITRPLGRMLPGIAGAVLVAAGLGQVAGRLAGRGLGPWVSIPIGGVFLIALGREINAAPSQPGLADPDNTGT